jgi:hypothetical protein
LARRLQQTKPGLKVIYTCNATTEKDKNLPATLERLGFMPKPYTPDKLIHAVQGCLHNGH